MVALNCIFPVYGWLTAVYIVYFTNYDDDLENQGIRLVSNLEALLALPGIDLVTVPVGINLHVRFARQVLLSGHACFLEKPVAGTLAEADAIGRAAERSGQRLFIGFQDLFHPGLYELKRRVRDGELGQLARITVTAACPRPRSYYERTAWAGRLALDGVPVRDSPAANACAHHLMLALFLAGAEAEAAAWPLAVAGRLWHGNAIETFDSAGLRFSTDSGVEVVFNVSHTTAGSFGPLVRLDGSVGSAEVDLAAEAPVWNLPGGRQLAYPRDVKQRFRHAAAVLRGDSAPVGTLAQARSHSAAIDLVHASLVAEAWPEQRLAWQGDQLVVDGLEAALRAAHAGGRPCDGRTTSAASAG